MATKFVGSAKVKINGMQVGTVPNTVEVMYGGMTRETQIADGIFHWKETPTPGSVKFEALWTDAFPFKTVNDLTDGLVEIETDVGTKIEVQQALRSGDPISAKSDNGRVAVEIAGVIALK